ncbi:hypothetical protein NIES2104_67580 [Leptolyngbya sp. NIES-2104]|nr:hypothetical protein NIES2104_67580 [Leptolyngbya sp. NIES-2104]
MALDVGNCKQRSGSKLTRAKPNHLSHAQDFKDSRCQADERRVQLV